MPTKGDNPANVFGAAQGYQFSDEKELDFSQTCDMEQTDQKIVLNTDMFGSFKGSLEWTKRSLRPDGRRGRSGYR